MLEVERTIADGFALIPKLRAARYVLFSVNENGGFALIPKLRAARFRDILPIVADSFALIPKLRAARSISLRARRHWLCLDSKIKGGKISICKTIY